MTKSFPTITSKKEFSRLYSSNKAVSSSVIVFANRAIETPLVAFVASKKVGSAVDRNRAKRLMRAALRAIVNPKELNLSLVLLARNSIITAKFSQIINDLRYCLRKAERWVE